MTEAMSDSRAADTNRLVSLIINYIPLDLATSLAPPLLLNDKSKRGWNHNITAAALCPLKLRAMFHLDPMYACYYQTTFLRPNNTFTDYFVTAYKVGRLGSRPAITHASYTPTLLNTTAETVQMVSFVGIYL